MTDIEGLLAEISPDSPCGEDLEYGAVSALDRAAQIKPEQQVGDTIVPAEEPEWGMVRRDALALFSETKDLRVAVILTNASIRTDGWPGFRDCLVLLDGLLERYWSDVHPQLDPDDDNDPTMRVNVIASLNDAATTLTYLREAPLVQSVMGRFSLRDILVAAGESEHPADSETSAPDKHTIEAAFKAADLDELVEITSAASQSKELLAVIEKRLMSLVGAGNAPDMTALSSLLKRADKEVGDGLALRPDAKPDLTGKEGGGSVSSEAVASVAAVPTAVAAAPARAQAELGPIADRDDVKKALEAVCEYYRNREPSSPVPILLERAKTLIYMDFLEIVQNLAPDGLNAVRNLRGPVEDESAPTKEDSSW